MTQKSRPLCSRDHASIWRRGPSLSEARGTGPLRGPVSPWTPSCRRSTRFPTQPACHRQRPPAPPPRTLHGARLPTPPAPDTGRGVLSSAPSKAAPRGAFPSPTLLASARGKPARPLREGSVVEAARAGAGGGVPVASGGEKPLPKMAKGERHGRPYGKRRGDPEDHEGAVGSQGVEVALALRGEIRDAADHGERSALLCYADCGAEQLSAVRELERRGFEIESVATSGGVLQCPGYYAEW